MTIKMDVLLVAGHVVEAAGDFLVVLFDLLRIELKDDDCELVALDETTVRIDSERLGHDWGEPEVSWGIGFVVELDCLILGLVQRARGEEDIRTWCGLDVCVFAVAVVPVTLFVSLN